MRTPSAMPGDMLTASALNLVSEGVLRSQSLTGSRTTRGTFFGRRRRVSASSDFDYSTFAFGFEVSGAVVTVLTGDVYRGSRDLIAVPDTAVTITADHQYIPLEVDLSANTAAIGTPTTTKPQPDSGVFRLWLYQFRLIGGVADLERAAVLGNVYLPGVGA